MAKGRGLIDLIASTLLFLCGTLRFLTLLSARLLHKPWIIQCIGMHL